MPLLLLLPILLLPVAAAADVPAPVRQAIERALAHPGARVEIESFDADCAVERAEARGAVDGSGRVALRLAGAGCPAWAWARVRVYAPALVVREAIADGEPIGDKVRREERELRAGREPLVELPGDARADQPLSPGTILEARHLRRAGPAPGDPVRVVLRAGSITIEQIGRVVPCRQGACATLPGGKRVAGRLSGDRLLVEAK